MARYHVGVVHERKGNTEAAAREFQRSIDEGISEVSSVFHLAQIRRAEGREEEAKALLERAREFGAQNSRDTSS